MLRLLTRNVLPKSICTQCLRRIKVRRGLATAAVGPDSQPITSKYSTGFHPSTHTIGAIAQDDKTLRDILYESCYLHSFQSRSLIANTSLTQVTPPKYGPSTHQRQSPTLPALDSLKTSTSPLPLASPSMPRKPSQKPNALYPR